MTLVLPYRVVVEVLWISVTSTVPGQGTGNRRIGYLVAPVDGTPVGRSGKIRFCLVASTYKTYQAEVRCRTFLCRPCPPTGSGVFKNSKIGSRTREPGSPILKIP